MSYRSSTQPNKLECHGVFKMCNVSDEAQIKIWPMFSRTFDFSFPYFCFLQQIWVKISIYFPIRCSLCFAWEICVRPIRIDPVAHSRRVTIVFGPAESTFILKGGQNNFLTAASLFHDHKTTIPRTRLYFQFAFIVIGFAITSANFLQCRRTIIFSWAATLVETVRFDETFSVFSTCYQITNAYRKQRNGKSTRKWINWKRGK